MEGKEIICISCPKGCRITVQNRGEEIISITGNDCPKGIKYAKGEFINPLRILPTTVKVIGGELPLVSVKTEKAIPKRLLLKAFEHKIISHVPECSFINPNYDLVQNV